jgi:hypothetical protein
MLLQEAPAHHIPTHAARCLLLLVNACARSSTTAPLLPANTQPNMRHLTDQPSHGTACSGNNVRCCFCCCAEHLPQYSS